LRARITIDDTMSEPLSSHSGLQNMGVLTSI